MNSENILNLITRNRISSVEVSDALDKTGVLENIHALNTGHFAAGEVKYVYAHSASNWPVHEQIRGDMENKILYVDAFGCSDLAIFGDIVSKYLFLYKKVKAVVVNGRLRDAHRLRKEDYPIWCTGVTPLGCSNRNITPDAKTLHDAETNRLRFEGSLLICDDSGVAMISKAQQTEATFERLEFMELQEDIWYYCVDTLKWDTFETICHKNYLKDSSILPEAIRKKLEKFSGKIS